MMHRNRRLKFGNGVEEELKKAEKESPYQHPTAGPTEPLDPEEKKDSSQEHNKSVNPDDRGDDLKEKKLKEVACGSKNNDMDDKINDDDDDDREPLWIRSDHQPTEIPPCPYCHAPRAFEFQLMPQMLSFLHSASNRAPPPPSSSSPSSSEPTTAHPGDDNDDNDDADQHSTTAPPSTKATANETAKKALIAAQSIIDSADPSQVPPSFVDAKIKAMKALEDELYQDDIHRVDWGVVAIYSCTKSCTATTSSSNGGGGGGGSSLDPKLGAYREEFAWVQPPLDT